MKFSVLISVYIKDVPEYVTRCLNSMIDQTLKPSEIVLVKDGPITKDLDNLIEEYQRKYPDLFKVLKLKENLGTARALNIGIQECSYDVVAKMDSDDICDRIRFEKQVNFLAANPDIDVVGSFITEFDGEDDDIFVVRDLPLIHEDISKFAKWRNPMNHVTLMYKKEAVLKAGNYQVIDNNAVIYEDYYLIVRMLINGSKMANIPECLVNVRSGRNMLNRRKGLKYIFIEYKFYRELLKIGFITKREFIRNIISKTALRLMPDFLRKFVYMYFLRKQVDTVKIASK